MPEHMMASDGESPVRNGTSTVDPNMLMKCWMPSGMAFATGTRSSTPMMGRSAAMEILSVVMEDGGKAIDALHRACNLAYDTALCKESSVIRQYA